METPKTRPQIGTPQQHDLHLSTLLAVLEAMTVGGICPIRCRFMLRISSLPPEWYRGAVRDGSPYNVFQSCFNSIRTAAPDMGIPQLLGRCIYGILSHINDGSRYATLAQKLVKSENLFYLLKARSFQKP